MASWPAREKRGLVVIVELLEATRRLQTAGWRPPLLGGRQAQRTLRRALPAQPE